MDIEVMLSRRVGRGKTALPLCRSLLADGGLWEHPWGPNPVFAAPHRVYTLMGAPTSPASPTSYLDKYLLW